MRMKHRLFNLLALLSLLGCLAVAGLAVRGQFASAGATFGPQNDRITWRFMWRDDGLYTYYGPGYVTSFSLYIPPASFAGTTWTRGHSADGVPIVTARFTVRRAPLPRRAASAGDVLAVRVRPAGQPAALPGMWRRRLGRGGGMKPGRTRFVAAVSVLLCVAVAGAWAWSYFPEQLHVRSYRGRLHLFFAARHWWRMFDGQEQNYPTDALVQEVNRFASGDPDSLRLAFAGFELSLSDRQSGAWMFVIPYWALALPPAGAAAWARVAGRTRRRRERAGQCLRCGYDLRATPGVCPECGPAASVSTGG
jgi:hypothetical protein